MQGPNVAVFGEIYSQNVGDGLIFECAEHAFSRLGVRVTPVDISGRTGWGDIRPRSHEPSLVKRLASGAANASRTVRRCVSYAKWLAREREVLEERWESIIADSDGVIVGGGQLLTDRDFGFPPRIRAISKIARRLRKPFAVYGCGAGRWGYHASSYFAQSLMQAKYISARDRYSANLLQRVSGQAVQIHPDLAFCARIVYAPVAATRVTAVNIQPLANFQIFASGLSRLTQRDYINYWADLVERLRSKEDVSLIVNGAPADYNAADEVKEELRRRGIDVPLLPRPRDPRQLIEQIGAHSSLLGCRMHSAIPAFSLGLSVSALGWDRKVRDVWEYIGRGDVVHSSDKIVRGDLSYSFARAGASELEVVEERIYDSASSCLSALGLT